jgi:protein gp37
MSTVSLELLPKRDAGQWWSEPWGLVRGCTHVSAGCNYCWLEVQSARFPWGRPHTANGKWNGNVQMQPYQLSKPVGMKRPQVFAVWSDLFHEDVSVHFIDSAWLTMKDSYWHTFVVLTKRPARMVKFLQFHERTTPNIILATSVEDQAAADERLPYLRDLSRAGWRTMVSYEPALGAISIEPWLWVAAGCPSWVIAGGETGPKRRKIELVWFRMIRDKCQRYGVPFWLKHINEEHGRTLDGVDHNGFPEIGNE